MKVWYDRSLLGASDSEFTSRGYAEDDIYSVNICFEYSEYQKKENRRNAQLMTPEQWSAHCTAAAKNRSDYIFPVMEAIAKSFVCYQYDKEHELKYSSPDWELFFWCNDFSATSNSELYGRDHSYIRLSFNRLHETIRHKEICDRLLAFVAERFSELDNLSVAVQHTTRFFDEKIDREAAELAKGFDGMRCRYLNMDGRLFYNGEKLFFMKKRARTRGYALSPREILMMSWEAEAA